MLLDSLPDSSHFFFPLDTLPCIPTRAENRITYLFSHSSVVSRGNGRSVVQEIYTQTSKVLYRDRSLLCGPGEQHPYILTRSDVRKLCPSISRKIRPQCRAHIILSVDADPVFELSKKKLEMVSTLNKQNRFLLSSPSDLSAYLSSIAKSTFLINHFKPVWTIPSSVKAKDSSAKLQSTRRVQNKESGRPETVKKTRE